MQSSLFKGRCTARIHRQTRSFPWSRLLLLGLLGNLGWDCRARADGLSWKLKPGEVLRYAVEEKMTQASRSGEKQTKGSQTRTTNLSWNVKGVAENGDADIVLRFERVRMHIEQPPFMPFDLDSSAPKVDAPDPFGSIAQQFRAMAGVEFTFKLKPNGTVEDVKIPENTLKTLRAGIPDAATQNMFSEQGLKDLLSQSTPPPFPDNAVAPGSSWTSKPAKIPTPIGSVVVDKTFTTLGPDPKNPDVLLIGTETKISIEPQENAGVSAKIQSQEGKGSLSFDMKSGRILSTRLDQKMQLVIAQAADPNQKLDQTTETVSTMTLER
jgi:hypothetical protein